MVDYRSLLDSIGVEWKDRGSNTSKGNINIGCPFCPDDPSFHLSISEEDRGYYCYREPRHSGTNMIRLLVRLGVAYADVPGLLNSFNHEAVTARPSKPVSVSDRAWARFKSAAESSAAIGHLSKRGFPTSGIVARQYDLRVAEAGRWAQRLLVPLRWNGELVTWIGRSLRDGIEPKYLMESVSKPVIYVPRRPRRTLIVTEGSMDALKIAVATEPYDISSAALLGHGLSGDRLTQVSNIANDCDNVLVALDTDRQGRYLNYSVSDCYAIVDELATQVACPVERLEVPIYRKDPGELSIDEVREWLAAWI